MSRADEQFWNRVLAIVVAGLLTAVAGRYVTRLLDSAEANMFGYTPNPAGVEAFLDELGEDRYFADAAPEAMEKAQEIDTFLYRSMDKAHRARYGKPFVAWRQEIGDCVGFGAAGAIYCSESVTWDLGKTPEPPLIPSTESIYGGSRVEARKKPEGTGGWSDGSYGGAAARWLRDWGVIYRKPYENGIDLTTYSGARAKAWGNWGNGGEGDNGRLDAVAKRTPARHVVAVRTWEECKAALTAGFPITIASMQGFSNRTDDSGALAPSGQWAHQMCLVGIRFAHNAPADAPASAKKQDACLVLNSWGTRWLTYGGKYPSDQPDGTFWATKDVIERILAQNDSYAIGDVKTGFAWRDLHHGNWLDADDIPNLSKR